LPWTFFSGAVGAAVTSVVEGNALATKIYFPRPILPIVTVVSGFFGLIPGVVIMGGMALMLGADFGPALLLLVPAIALLLALATGFALVFSILQVYARDVKHIVSAIMLPWFWGSGIFYPLTVLSPTFRRYIEVNPAVGMVQLFRASIGAADPGWESALWWSLGWVSVLFVIAALLFRRYDRVCVDLL
ncbi:MAG: ABC transporter permease, partial [Actinomycetota bacterium]